MNPPVPEKAGRLRLFLRQCYRITSTARNTTRKKEVRERLKKPEASQGKTVSQAYVRFRIVPILVLHICYGPQDQSPTVPAYIGAGISIALKNICQSVQPLQDEKTRLVEICMLPVRQLHDVCSTGQDFGSTPRFPLI